MIDITDRELDQIEKEVAEYELEEYPISGVQVRAIINRLRRAEKASDTMAPFMRYYTDKDRLKRANEAWMLPRLGVFLVALFASGAFVALNGTLAKFAAAPGLITGGFTLLSFLIPMVGVVVPLTGWIDRKQHQYLLEGRYDEDYQKN